MIVRQVNNDGDDDYNNNRENMLALNFKSK